MDTEKLPIKWSAVIMSYYNASMQYYQKRKEPYNTLPTPEHNFIWIWYSELNRLDGHCGWLEVNLHAEKYGRYFLQKRYNNAK